MLTSKRDKIVSQTAPGIKKRSTFIVNCVGIIILKMIDIKARIFGVFAGLLMTCTLNCGQAIWKHCYRIILFNWNFKEDINKAQLFRSFC